MKLILLFIIGILASFAVLAAEDVQIMGWPWPDHSNWDLKVPQAVMDAAPRWLPSDGPIPLSPDDAIKKASKACAALGLGDFQFTALYLDVRRAFIHPHNRPPAYDITFADAHHRNLTFRVFLDGTVVSPRRH